MYLKTVLTLDGFFSATMLPRSGVSRTAVKKQSALSPDEGNESTGSEGSKVMYLFVEMPINPMDLFR